MKIKNLLKKSTLCIGVFSIITIGAFACDRSEPRENTSSVTSNEAIQSRPLHRRILSRIDKFSHKEDRTSYVKSVMSIMRELDLNIDQATIYVELSNYSRLIRSKAAILKCAINPEFDELFEEALTMGRNQRESFIYAIVASLKFDTNKQYLIKFAEIYSRLEKFFKDIKFDNSLVSNTYNILASLGFDEGKFVEIMSEYSKTDEFKESDFYFDSIDNFGEKLCVSAGIDEMGRYTYHEYKSCYNTPVHCMVYAILASANEELTTYGDLIIITDPIKFIIEYKNKLEFGKLVATIYAINKVVDPTCNDEFSLDISRRFAESMNGRRFDYDVLNRYLESMKHRGKVMNLEQYVFSYGKYNKIHNNFAKSYAKLCSGFEINALTMETYKKLIEVGYDEDDCKLIVAIKSEIISNLSYNFVGPYDLSFIETYISYLLTERGSMRAKESIELIKSGKSREEILSFICKSPTSAYPQSIPSKRMSK